MRTKIDKSNPFKLIYDSNSNIILEQRIKIYTTALGMYKNQRGIGHYYGMCRAIMEALDEFDLSESDIDGMIVYAGNLSNYLPEFKKLEQEFEVNVNEDGYWWDIETDRTPFFEAMIEEATNKSKNINKKLGYEYTLSKVKGSEFQRVKIKSSKDIADFAKVLYKDDIEIYESFFIITLNQANIITGWAKISQGGISATIVDVRLVSKIAIDSLSSCIVLIHNHPSGNLFPSKSDDLITTKIKEGLSLFDIKVLDHIILTERNKYFSYTDEGKIQ